MQNIEKSPLIVDFVGGSVGHRFRSGEGRSQDLAKALGFASGITPDVVDATAGLGRDSFFLASLGAKVTLIERSPTMHALLADGMERARQAGMRYAQTVSRMTLMLGDARDLLPQLAPKVVLIDPMHPPREKSALVKKELRQVRDIVGDDPDSKELLAVALDVAQNRVALKWPLRSDFIDGMPRPSHQILGSSTRYDVFVKARLLPDAG